VTRTSSLLALFAAIFACLLAPSAQAQVTRTFVSGSGTANSSCSYAEPCRFFTQAVAALPSAGGEIDVLDPGSYGQITISNSVSIVGRGWTTITATSTTAAITVTGSGKVSIIGVQLDGGGTGQTGISFTGTGSLTVKDSVIRNFAGDAIDISNGVNVTLVGLELDGAGVGAQGINITNIVSATISDCVVHDFVKNGIVDSSTFSVLQIVNTISTNNGYGGGNFSGIYIVDNNAGGGSTSVTMTGVTATGNGGNGVAANGAYVIIGIFSSNLSNNGAIFNSSGGDGIVVQNNAAVTVRDTLAANNYNAGFEAQSSGQLTLAHSVASENYNHGILVNGGTVNTYRDNNVFQTIGTPVSGTTTTITAY
jgi:hypothetical protein